MRGSAGSATDSRGHAPGEAFAGVAFAAERRPWQRSLNWETPRPGRRRLVVAVLAAVVATLLELSGFDALMRGRVAHERRAPASAPIVVRLEDLLPEPPPEMQPSSRMPASAITRTTARTAPGAERPRRPRTDVVDAPAAAAASPPLLVERDGRALLPDGSALVAPKDGARMFRHDSAVPYAQTRFEQAFVPRDEDLTHEFIRRTTVKHTWRTPWGSQITCAASMTIVLLGGCGWGLAPRATAEELQRMRANPPPSKPDKSMVLRLRGS
ncbi:hypothetical protein [Dokdonella sp.]|uniref:hypothetical protein n=1 Tax=Dokdonella sp. TaxID=2291710 RepID=UPI003784431A